MVPRVNGVYSELFMQHLEIGHQGWGREHDEIGAIET
jgi:hypothetical protein